MKKAVLLIVVVLALAGCKTVDHQSVDYNLDDAPTPLELNKELMYVDLSKRYGVRLPLTRAWEKLQEFEENGKRVIQFYIPGITDTDKGKLFPCLHVVTGYFGLGEIIYESRKSPAYLMENFIAPKVKGYNVNVFSGRYVESRRFFVLWYSYYLDQELLQKVYALEYVIPNSYGTRVILMYSDDTQPDFVEEYAKRVYGVEYY